VSSSVFRNSFADILTVLSDTGFDLALCFLSLPINFDIAGDDFCIKVSICLTAAVVVMCHC